MIMRKKVATLLSFFCVTLIYNDGKFLHYLVFLANYFKKFSTNVFSGILNITISSLFSNTASVKDVIPLKPFLTSNPKLMKLLYTNLPFTLCSLTFRRPFLKSGGHHIVSRLYAIGFRGNLPQILQSFLQDRKLSVRVQVTISSPVLIQNGVPQGEVLSCSS